MSGPDPVAVLRAVCADGVRRASGADLRAELARIGRQLDRPLQLAVAGAVGVGKSTLINAVLRRPVAPVDAGECTRAVTWYEFGARDRVLVECTNGTVSELGLVHGRVPAALGVALEHVVRLRVQFPDPWLRRVIVIDTPGIDTVSQANEKATRRLLFGDAAAEHAQALLYVLRYVQSVDADVLAEFRTLSTACGMSAVNTAAVLTQVDRRGDEVDPWPTACRLARKATADLGALVLDVVPVVGLLAETARGRLLGPAEVAALRELAVRDPADLEDLLVDLEEFTEKAIGPPIPLQLRRTLVACLHRYGIREAVAHLRRHPQASADQLHRWLAGRSGFGSDDAVSSPTRTWQVTPDDPELVRTLAEVLDRFARHAGRLKAFTAVQRLARLTGGPRDRALLDEIRATVDENRPVVAGLRSLRILAACAAVARGQLRLDETMTAELMALARRDDPATQLGLPPTAAAPQIVAAAGEASRRWRRVAQLAGPSVGGQRARDVLAVVEDIAAAARAPDRTPSPIPPRIPPPIPAAIHRPIPDADAEDPGTALDRPALERLLGSPVLAAKERAAVAALLDATELSAVVGAPPGSSRADLATAAAELAGRFRALLHRSLPPQERRTVQAICDTMESISGRMS
ncbi:MAG TPA: dynamin family protein [Pseudonocardia sp.]|nr:dynamin family protein [Pseudonocardia sp.]